MFRVRCLLAVITSAAFVSNAAAAEAVAPNPDKNAYFGAVHIHTGYSFDAFTNGTLTTPANAYEWAQGKAIPGGGGRARPQDQDAARFLRRIGSRRVHGRVPADERIRTVRSANSTSRSAIDVDAIRTTRCRRSPRSCAT